MELVNMAVVCTHMHVCVSVCVCVFMSVCVGVYYT